MENRYSSEAKNFRRFWMEKVERSSLDEKLRVALEFLKWRNMLPILTDARAKSATKAAELRALGNTEYRLRRCVSASKYYTRCVAVAPIESSELAFAYANRSAALFERTLDRDCLLDINRALQQNYPLDKRQKLTDRKRACVRRFREMMRAAKVLPPCVMELINRHGAYVEELDREFNPDLAEPLDSHFARFRAPKPNSRNKLVPNASGKIKIKNRTDNKITIIATANIKPGEILATEKPFAASLLVEYRYSNCANCYMKCDSLIHCPDCSMVMYCSVQCRENAYKSFHRIECQIFKLLPYESKQITLTKWVAFRTLMVATKQGQELDQLMNHPVYKSPLAKKCRPKLKEKFDSEDFSSVFYCGKHPASNNFKDFGSEFPLSYFLNVVEWLYLLRHTTFFGQPAQPEGEQKLDAPFTDRELYVGAFLLRCLQNDNRAIREGLEKDYAFLEEVHSVVSPIGHGVFPFMNLFYHSCDPHVRMFSYENALVCRAIRPIKAGEQIFDSYVISPFHSNPKYERSAFLRQNFNFDCNCKPCQKNWPILEKLPFTFPKVVSDGIDMKKFNELSAKFQKIKDNLAFEDLNNAKTREFLCQYLTVLDDRFERPCRESIHCEIILELSLHNMANFYNPSED